MAFFPLIRPFALPWSGNWIWMQPSRAEALLHICGDVGTNVGAFAVGALSHPDNSGGKYVYVRTDRLSFTDITKVWSEVSGKVADMYPSHWRGLLGCGVPGARRWRCSIDLASSGRTGIR